MVHLQVPHSPEEGWLPQRFTQTTPRSSSAELLPAEAFLSPSASQFKAGVYCHFCSVYSLSALSYLDVTLLVNSSTLSGTVWWEECPQKNFTFAPQILSSNFSLQQNPQLPQKPLGWCAASCPYSSDQNCHLIMCTMGCPTCNSLQPLLIFGF